VSFLTVEDKTSRALACMLHSQARELLSMQLEIGLSGYIPHIIPKQTVQCGALSGGVLARSPNQLFVRR
jgi:hypothetical protein